MTQVSEALFLLFKGQNEHEAQNRRNVQLVNFEGSHPHEEEFAWPRIAGLENALALADLADLTTWQPNCFASMKKTTLPWLLLWAPGPKRCTSCTVAAKAVATKQRFEQRDT